MIIFYGNNLGEHDPREKKYPFIEPPNIFTLKFKTQL